jgi:hypothetical protein
MKNNVEQYNRKIGRILKININYSKKKILDKYDRKIKKKLNINYNKIILKIEIYM